MMDRQFIPNDEVIMIKPVAPVIEGEDQIPDNVKRLEEDDIISAEVVYESSRIKKVNESLDVTRIANSLNLSQCQVDFISSLDNGNKVYIATGIAATGDAWLYLFEILDNESVPYNTFERYLGNMPITKARTEGTKIANQWIEKRNSGVEFSQLCDSLGGELVAKIFESEEKVIASDIQQGQTVRYKGKLWVAAGHEGVDDDLVINCLDDGDTTRISGKKKLEKVNESTLDDEIARWELISSTDFWKKFKEDWENADVYNHANELLVDYAMQPEKLKEKLSNLFTNYDMLEDYVDLLNSAVFEYKNKGTYIANDEEVEDLYYIQKGDFITVNHKDYGLIKCQVSRVDADKNKVYFKSVEKGLMGVCGFDKIHGIELVDECKDKKGIFENKLTEVDWSELNNLIETHKKAGNIERTLNNSKLNNSSEDKIEFAIYCPDNDKLDAFLTEYNFLKYGNILDVVYVSTNNVILKSRPLDKINESYENTSVVSISDNFCECGYYDLVATQTGSQFSDIYIQLGCDPDNLIPRKLIDMTSEEFNTVKAILNDAKDDQEAFDKLVDLGFCYI